MKKVCEILLLCFLLSGCALRTRTVPLCQVVEKVEVVGTCGEEVVQRTYTTSEKKVAILNYLRMLHPIYRAKGDPQRQMGEEYEITVWLSGGEKTVYHQKGLAYLQKNQEPWLMIDPEKSETLYPLLLEMGSDE